MSPPNDPHPARTAQPSEPPYRETDVHDILQRIEARLAETDAHIRRIHHALTGDIVGEHTGLLQRVRDLEQAEAERRWWQRLIVGSVATLAATRLWDWFAG